MHCLDLEWRLTGRNREAEEEEKEKAEVEEGQDSSETETVMRRVIIADHDRRALK